MMIPCYSLTSAQTHGVYRLVEGFRVIETYTGNSFHAERETRYTPIRDNYVH